MGLRCLFLGQVVRVATCFSGGAIGGPLAFSTPRSFARSHSFLLLIFTNAWRSLPLAKASSVGDLLQARKEDPEVRSRPEDLAHRLRFGSGCAGEGAASQGSARGKELQSELQRRWGGLRKPPVRLPAQVVPRCRSCHHPAPA